MSVIGLDHLERNAIIGRFNRVGAVIAIAQVAGWRIRISPESVVLAMAFAIGVFFGFCPARKAVRFNAVETLRFE